MATFTPTPRRSFTSTPHPVTIESRIQRFIEPFATAFMAIPTALAITSNVCTTPRGLNLSLAWFKRHGIHPFAWGFFTIVSSLHHPYVRRRFSGTVYTIGLWVTI